MIWRMISKRSRQEMRERKLPVEKLCRNCEQGRSKIEKHYVPN